MMLAAIGREFSRQLSEYKQFKVNLLFANLGIFFLVTGFLNYFDSQQDTFELFILLFTWYFSSHSITHPTYFIEDEIADRTIINVIQSRRSIFGMLFIKIIVQILLDLVKAIPLFCLVALVQQIAFPTDWVILLDLSSVLCGYCVPLWSRLSLCQFFLCLYKNFQYY